MYVLKSKIDGKRYIGIADDVRHRLKEHNMGRVRSTKARAPFLLIYEEQLTNKVDARSREKYFKSAAGRRWLDKLESRD